MEVSLHWKRLDYRGRLTPLGTVIGEIDTLGSLWPQYLVG
jgi:hypothetical protein